MVFLLSMVGVLIGGGTIAFVLWQLGWVTLLSMVNLEVLVVWCGFLAAVAVHNKMPRFATAFVSIGFALMLPAIIIYGLLDKAVREPAGADAAVAALVLLAVLLIVSGAYAAEIKHDLKVAATQPA